MAVYTVNLGTDDCYQRLTNSLFSRVSDYLSAGGGGATNKQWGGGMRFTNILIPNAATILTAVLTVQASSSTAGAVCRTRISAEQENNPVTFADDGVAFAARWANRTAQVDWDVEAFTIDNDYDSPDFKGVIQAIVDRVGWASGQSIVIFWEDFEDRSTAAANCMRSAKTFEHVDNAPPKLTITYSAGWTGKMSGVTNPAKIMEVDVANIAKSKGVA